MPPLGNLIKISLYTVHLNMEVNIVLPLTIAMDANRGENLHSNWNSSFVESWHAETGFFYFTKVTHKQQRLAAFHCPWRMQGTGLWPCLSFCSLKKLSYTRWKKGRAGQCSGSGLTWTVQISHISGISPIWGVGVTTVYPWLTRGGGASVWQVITMTTWKCSRLSRYLANTNC